MSVGIPSFFNKSYDHSYFSLLYICVVDAFVYSVFLTPVKKKLNKSGTISKVFAFFSEVSPDSFADKS